MQELRSVDKKGSFDQFIKSTKSKNFISKIKKTKKTFN